MLYQGCQFGAAAAAPAQAAADLCRLMLNTGNPLFYTAAGRAAVTGWAMLERATRRHHNTGFGIAQTSVRGHVAAVSEKVVWQTPFCRLLHFRRVGIPARADPRLLIVAPLSGHFATLLRGTVEAFLPEHEVYITDWQDAREVPVSAGGFDLDDYIDAMIAILRRLGSGVHVLALCQPSVPVLAATALMEAAGEPSVPATLILAGGPVDTRIGRTPLDALAQTRGADWFRRNLITTVPWPFPGRGRAVYPGFFQLCGFMAVHLEQHLHVQGALFPEVAHELGKPAARHRTFFDEYLTVMDLTAEFYLQTIETVFVANLLPRGLLASRGRRVDLAAIERPAIMTIEGEKDDITGRGRCRAALGLCRNVPEHRKLHLDCPEVGHFGIFTGSRFRTLIAPRIARFLRAAAHPQAQGAGPSFPCLAIDKAPGAAPRASPIDAAA